MRIILLLIIMSSAYCMAGETAFVCGTQQNSRFIIARDFGNTGGSIERLGKVEYGYAGVDGVDRIYGFGGMVEIKNSKKKEWKYVLRIAPDDTGYFYDWSGGEKVKKRADYVFSCREDTALEKDDINVGSGKDGAFHVDTSLLDEKPHSDYPTDSSDKNSKITVDDFDRIWWEANCAAGHSKEIDADCEKTKPH